MAPLLTFYGDDFTGSSAVMEVLGFAGVPTMLFLAPPGPETLARYPGLGAVGVAGVARSRSPKWMRAELPPIFAALKALGAPVAHYKVCSTFDSAPEIGSIGCAAEIGAEVFGAGPAGAPGGSIPLVVGAPDIRRYQAFGQLFAGLGAGDGIHRLDRHPVMARHPVTPMGEADLGRHLSAQTDLPVGVVDLAAMKAGRADDAAAACVRAGAAILALDVVDDETLAEAGRLIWRGGAGPVFALGSQGVEYALVAHWRAAGIIPAVHTPPPLKAVERLFAVSGSCAPTTAAQIDHAEARGFRIVPFDAAAAAAEPAAEPAAGPSAGARPLAAEAERVKTLCLSHLSEGADVLVATARGPGDPALARMAAAVAAAGVPAGAANDRLGAALGGLVRDIRAATGFERVAIAGGDTSGHALSALRAEALSAVAPLAPGAPLCRLHAPDAPAMDGLEVTLKGGQMGGPAFFSEARDGRA